jgi:hypothetical protein
MKTDEDRARELCVRHGLCWIPPVGISHVPAPEVVRAIVELADESRRAPLEELKTWLESEIATRGTILPMYTTDPRQVAKMMAQSEALEGVLTKVDALLDGKETGHG